MPPRPCKSSSITELSGNRIERCLSYDEKPLLLFQKLKDSKKNPVFMLKHIRDIRSPIAVAQQKQAARKATSVISNDTSSTPGHHKAPSTPRTNHRPPKLDVQDLSASTPLASSNNLSAQPGGWPEASVLTPAPGDNQHHESTSLLTPASAQTLHTQSSNGSGLSASTLVGSGFNGGELSKQQRGDDQPMTTSSGREIPPNLHGISYAVAIYPYMAEMDDEFDVVV